MLRMLPMPLLVFSCLLALFFVSGAPEKLPALAGSIRISPSVASADPRVETQQAVELQVICETGDRDASRAVRYTCRQVGDHGARWTLWYASDSRWLKGFSEADLRQVFADFAAAAHELEDLEVASEPCFVVRMTLQEGDRSRMAVVRGSARTIATLQARGGAWSIVHDEVTARVAGTHWAGRLADGPAMEAALAKKPVPGPGMGDTSFISRSRAEW